jgi:hypothetical protein
MREVQMNTSTSTSYIRTAIAATGASAIAALTICAALVTSAQAASAQLAPAQLVPAQATSSQPAPAQPASAQPETLAAIAPSLAPDRLGAKATLTFTIRYAGGPFGVPSPVRRSVLRFPAGLSLDIPHLSSCSAARLRARGPRGCPAQAAIGNGHALVETHAGSQTITEDVAMWAFLGPPDNLQPTFEILAQGYTPLDQRMVLTGTVLSADAPYGEELVMSIPPIPTLPLEPDASIVSFTLTIGADRHHRARGANTVLVPSSCPVGGFPFAAEFTYADGSSGDALATVLCPT